MTIKSNIEVTANVSISADPESSTIVVKGTQDNSEIRKAKKMIHHEISSLLAISYGNQVRSKLSAKEIKILKSLKSGSVLAMNKIFSEMPEIRAYKKVFDDADQSGDARIDEEEFQKNFVKLFPQADKSFMHDDASYLFHVIDTDESGKISWKEYLTFVLENQLIGSGSKILKVHIPKHYFQNIMAVKSNIEDTANVSISTDPESSTIVVKCTQDNSEIQKAKKMIHHEINSLLAISLSGNQVRSKLSAKEIKILKSLKSGSVHAMNKIFSEMPEVRAYKKVFDDADQSGDARIDEEEFQKNFVKLFPRADKSFMGDDASYLFHVIDTDESGKICWKEFLIYGLENRLIDSGSLQ